MTLTFERDLDKYCEGEPAYQHYHITITCV